MPDRRELRRRRVQRGRFAVAVDIEVVTPDDEPSEPRLEPDAVRKLDEIARRAEQGDTLPTSAPSDACSRRSPPEPWDNDRSQPMSAEPTAIEWIPYEKRLHQDRRWGMAQGGGHFRKDNDVFRTMYAIADRLGKLGIPYAIVGGMALYEHGYERFTSDVDLLVTPEGLKEIHDRLEGLGYVPPFAGSKQLRDTATGVRVEFLISGAYPGDGKPKPVAFPDPVEVVEIRDGISFLRLPTLVELKLASGMTGGLNRSKDLTDVVELIKAISLPLEFAEQLDPYVRDRFKEIWIGIRDSPKGPDQD